MPPVRLTLRTLLATLAIGPAHAQGVSSGPGAANPESTRAYWTPERMRAARPLELYPAGPRDAMPAADAPSRSGPGAPPATEPPPPGVAPARP